MPKSIGQIIKQLRKERNFTQEELAEQLNISSQAVSKWENETSMPDISQIVPIATVFGVSTDVLFDTFGISDEDEVKNIIENAYKLKKGDTESLKRVYDELQSGLQRYPNNITLLMNSLEMGITLAYPENKSYDVIHANEIYNECIRQANVAITYSKNVTDTLRAHMIMVLLHSSYGDSEKAWQHAKHFPWRADMTIHEMSAYIAHAEKKYSDESLYCQRDFMFHFEAMLDDIVQIGETKRIMGNYDEALELFYSVFSLIKQIFEKEDLIPPLHCRERGDVHSLIAKTYLEKNDKENAVIWLKKMVDYDIGVRSKFKNDKLVSTPFLRDVKYTFYWAFGDNKKKLLSKLNDNNFDCLKDDSNFVELLNQVNNM